MNKFGCICAIIFSWESFLEWMEKDEYKLPNLCYASGKFKSSFEAFALKQMCSHYILMLHRSTGSDLYTALIIQWRRKKIIYKNGTTLVWFYTIIISTLLGIPQGVPTEVLWPIKENRWLKNRLTLEKRVECLHHLLDVDRHVKASWN